MRIIVTGGYGFIGSNFIHYIVNKEVVDSVFNVDSVTYAANRANLESNSANARKIVNVEVDINHTSFFTQFLSENNITHIVHFAAESHVDRSISGPAEFIHSNINGTFSLLEASRSYGKLKRFHHVSTDEVYGSLGDTGFFSETTPYDPRSPYSASKASSDHLVRAYNHTYKLPVTLSNCSNNYGPRQNSEKLIPKIIKSVREGIKVPIYGNGKNIRDWLYVDDHCEAIWDILTRGKDGESYNVGGDCELNNLQILDRVCQAMGKDPADFITFVEDRKGHDFRYAINFSKIHNELGWIPKTSFEQGILKTIETL